MDENKSDFLTTAYTAHKAEISKRRMADVYMSGLSMLFYMISIRMVQVRPPASAVFSDLTIKLTGTIIFVVITDLIVYFLVKNYNRLCEMEQMIARFDTAFGFFEKGAYLPGESLYPDGWKTHGTKRLWSAACRALIPILFCLVVIALFWFREM